MKQASLDALVAEPRSIARQQWRARIETDWVRFELRYGNASPASNGGRGLKQVDQACYGSEQEGIARQQWRARIETKFGGW